MHVIGDHYQRREIYLDRDEISCYAKLKLQRQNDLVEVLAQTVT